MKKIGCFAYSPASANNILAMKEKLEHIFDVKIFPFHPYAQSILKTETSYTYNDIPTLFEQYHFDLIITGTGSGDNPIEQDIPLLAKKNNIICISILDCFWMDDENLRIRFEKNTPEYITSPNEEIKKRLINLFKISEMNVLNIGIPHYDRLKKYINATNSLEDQSTMGFFSSCSTNEDFSDTHPLVKKAITELAEWVKNQNHIKRVLVTKHPREDGKWITEFCKNNQGFIFTTESSWNVLLKSNIVFGIPSALLQEARIIGKYAVIYENEGDIANLKTPVKPKHNEFVSSMNASEQLTLFIQHILK